jgi:DGQHR domain-containing protein
VIDGQHRLAGASEASHDINVVVTAFLDLSTEDQITQFITINREAKRVPTSLYLDLLPEIKGMEKNETELAKERAVDLANAMKVDESSQFFNRIVALKAPTRGQISLTNFVRKVSPLVHRSTGILRGRTEREQRAVIENYYGALSDVFPKEYEAADTVFFRTIGFGGVMNAFPKVHDTTLRRTQDSFTRVDVVETLKLVSDFQFNNWKRYGTGSAAEIQAGKELSDALQAAAGPIDEEVGTLKV